MRRKLVGVWYGEGSVWRWATGSRRKSPLFTQVVLKWLYLGSKKWLFSYFASFHWLFLSLCKGAISRIVQLEMFSPKASKSSFCVMNPCQSSPSLIFCVPLRFFIISLMFFFSMLTIIFRFPSAKGIFVHGQRNSTLTEPHKTVIS